MGGEGSVQSNHPDLMLTMYTQYCTCGLRLCKSILLVLPVSPIISSVTTSVLYV